LKLALPSLNDFTSVPVNTTPATYLLSKNIHERLSDFLFPFKVIGQTMQYHPHGDASIGDALVNIGQKDLLIETQGNWGDVRTGDDAAAPRYIEGRLSKFALEVAFNAKTTEWQLSYDGRKNEPVTLANEISFVVSAGCRWNCRWSCNKNLPHNFCELIDASIKYLRGKRFELFPDFQTGGRSMWMNITRANVVVK
jgi:topoisomerase-4 subunit A